MFMVEIIDANYQPVEFGAVKRWDLRKLSLPIVGASYFINLYPENDLNIGEAFTVYGEFLFSDEKRSCLDIGNDFHLLLTKVE